MVSYPTIGRKSVERAPIDEISEGEFRELFKSCLRADYGDHESTVKEVARNVASPETAKTWLQGISAPGFYKGLKLAAKSPSLAKEVVRLIAMEASLDPEQQQALAAFLRTVAK